jgi:hypothetical protein
MRPPQSGFVQTIFAEVTRTQVLVSWLGYSRHRYAKKV